MLALLASGLSNQEIAERLVMTVGTVKWYLHHLYGKLAVRGRTGAIARGRELGLIQ
jgi:LuxR family maltose regulon positive regulatory protein